MRTVLSKANYRNAQAFGESHFFGS